MPIRQETEMITAQSLVQLKAFARQDGAILAVVWCASMWCLFKWTETSWGPLLMLSTPFFITWRLQSFRDNALDGFISFRRALAYSCYVFFYASLIFALGQYLYFAFLDKGSFLNMLTESINLLKPLYKEKGIEAQDLDLALKTIKMMKPIDMVFTFMMNNLFIGAMASPIIALIGKRSKRV